MELSFSQIKQYTKGALLVTQEPNEYRFTRFIPEQQKSFGEVFVPWEVRSHYTSGIRLDFHTDASALHIVVGAEGNYEVLVDDLCVFFSPVAAEESINVPLDSGDHRVTIVLPSLSCGTLRSVRLEGETYIKSHTYSTTAIFYGDSITQGSTSIKSSESYTWLLTRNYDWDSINFGVGGIRFQPEVMLDLGCQAEIVIVSLGTNNFGSNKPRELLEATCPAYFDRLQALHPYSKIFCITPIWRADGDMTKNAGTIHDVRAFIEREAQLRNFVVIDGFSLVPHRTEYFADERLHPNDIGFALYAQNLIRALDQHL